jgi:ABC-type bacteriocin/lantibiotic exporter with double-glycine peptidase domain
MKSLTIREISESLEKLQIDFNTQLQHLNTDTITLNKEIIKLSSRYPEHAELLEFIIFVNDKVETRQTIFSEVVIDSFNSLVELKKEMIKEIISRDDITITAHKPTENKSWIEIIKSDYKFIGIILAVIIVSLTAMVQPQISTYVIDKVWPSKEKK